MTEKSKHPNTHIKRKKSMIMWNITKKNKQTLTSVRNKMQQESMGRQKYTPDTICTIHYILILFIAGTPIYPNSFYRMRKYCKIEKWKKTPTTSINDFTSILQYIQHEIKWRAWEGVCVCVCVRERESKWEEEIVRQ